MKKRMKTITTFVLLAFILSILSPCTVFAAETPQDAAKDAAMEYMSARNNTLTTGDTTALSAIAIPGVVADEVKHREYLAEKNMTLPKLSYTIDSVELLEGGAIVFLREISLFSLAGNNSIEIPHTIYITIRENGLPLVVSDRYFESYSGFASCSYVSPEDMEQNQRLSLTSRSCLLYITNKEVGYLEKATNDQLDSHTANPGSGKFSKYGQWIGLNPGEWCAAFVSWCGNEANIPTSCIPHMRSVPLMKNFYEECGRFYWSHAYGGNYVPQPGDIVTLFYQHEFGHMGIVYAVNGNMVTVIHGNWNDRVQKDVINITDAFLTGYGASNIPLDDHIWTGDSWLEYCCNCGAQRGYIQ